MQFRHLQLPKFLILIALAVALGVGVLQLDQGRRAAVTSSAQAAPVTAATPAPQPAASTPVDANPAAEAAAPGTLVAETAPAPVAAPVLRRRSGVVCSEPHRTVQVSRDSVIRATPGGRAVGTLPASSKYMGQSTNAWVQAVSPDGRWGRVTVPWTKPVGRAGWVRIAGMQGRRTSTMVVADLSDRQVTVFQGCRAMFTVPSAIGRPGSPSPTGRFWVTDRVAVPGAQQASFGTFAFGLSTVQPNLPQGWTGGDQMAIHGTGAPGSIGEAASAGCLRVSEQALARLKPLLRTGTPVVIQA